MGPQGLDQLVTTGQSMAVEDQVREEEPALAPWQPAVEALAAPLDDGRPAQLDTVGRATFLPGWTWSEHAKRSPGPAAVKQPIRA
jgi:hypothetical protein